MEWGNKPASYQVPSLLSLAPQRQQQYCSHQFGDDSDTDTDTEQQTQLCKVEHDEDDPRSSSNAYFADRYPGTDGGFVSGHSRHLTDAPPFGFPSSAAALSHHQSMQGPTTSMAALDAVHSSNGNAHFASAHMLDLQNFDDSVSVDLQQLFPQPAVGAAMMATNSALQALHTNQQLAPYYAAAAAAQGQHQTAPTEFFSENFQSAFHADPSQGALPPFSFSSSNQPQQPSSSMFDDRDEMVMPEMHEVSSLFGNASLMTPPMSIITPRTSIVSPMNGGFLPPRSAAIGNASAPAAASHGALPMMREGNDGSSMAVETSPKFSPDRRKLCCIEGCKSQARAFNRCKRHGGSKRCSHPGCTKSVQSRGLCIRHGGGSRCQESGCTRAAQSHGRCKMHGGGRPCIVAGCEKKAHLKRLCRKHGGGAKCCLEDCDKWAQRLGMCMTHSKHASPTTTTSRGTSLRAKKDSGADTMTQL